MEWRRKVREQAPITLAVPGRTIKLTDTYVLVGGEADVTVGWGVTSLRIPSSLIPSLALLSPSMPWITNVSSTCPDGRRAALGGRRANPAMGTLRPHSVSHLVLEGQGPQLW